MPIAMVSIGFMTASKDDTTAFCIGWCPGIICGGNRCAFFESSDIITSVALTGFNDAALLRLQ